MKPAHRRNSSVVLPVPVVPTTTWCDRILAYGMLATGPAGWPTARITAPGTRSPLRVVSGTAPGAAILARALRA